MPLFKKRVDLTHPYRRQNLFLIIVKDDALHID